MIVKRSHRLTATHAKQARLAIAMVALFCSVARGDVVAARGKAPLVSTQILRLQDGRLLCRADGGQEISFPLEQVDYLQITGWQMLNLAEKQRRAGDWRKAAVSYERALADLQLDAAEQPGNSPPVMEPGLDRTLLVKSRLIAAWDAQARLERAVELYLDVIEAMPQALEGLRPTNFPETGSAVLEFAAQQVDAVIARHGDDEIGRSLSKWRSSWPQRPVASQPAAAQGASANARESDMGGQVTLVAELVQAGRRQEALARIHELHKQFDGHPRADLYYWQGRALEPTALPQTATQPAETSSFGRAGLSYMRVVVHFPRHPLAAECLYRAGEMCRRAGQRQQAATLWSELIANYPQVRSPDGQLWAERAREELDK